MHSFKKVLAGGLLVLLPALHQHVRATAPPEKNEANLLLLEVRLGRQVLSEAVTAYQLENDILLPIGELARLLTIAVRATPGEGRASGYLLSEERGFSLDVPQGQVVIEGRREPLERARIKLMADDVYVASRLLARWLPVDLEVDLPSLSVTVRPREQLPLQARLERGARGKQAGQLGYVAPDYPRHPEPYRLADMPFIDQTIGLDVQQGNAGRQINTTYAAYLTADLLGMEGSLYASRNRRDPGAGIRFTLGRHDPDAGLLGPLHARTALAGSIPVPGLDNIAFSSPTGTGITLSNRPLDQPTRFDSHSLQGPLPPGWDVELYFNEALVGFQQSRPDGKYSFDDQPLAYGPNDFRLVFHGPLGQLRVERQSFLLEQSAVAPGALYYHLTEHRDSEGRARSVAQLDWGVASFLSANAALARLPVDGVEQRYATVGLHGYWQSFILSADMAQAGNGGKLAQVGLKTRVAGLSFSASRAQLRDFTSELYTPGPDPVHARDELRVDGALGAGTLPALPVSLHVKRDTLASKAENIEVVGRISAYRNGTALSNGWRWQSLDGVRAADGGLQVSRRVAGIGINGQLLYALLPHASLSSAALSADRYLADGYLANIGLVRSFPGTDYRVSAALNKSLGSYGLGVSGFYSSRHEFGAGLQLFLAIGREPRRSRWLTDAQPIANAGAASIRVYLDKNLNGVMDDGDEALKGAGFTVNGGNHLARTDAAGFAYLNRLPPNQYVDIGLDPATLEDPQWQPRLKGVRLVPRQGKVSQIDFAVSLTGEIDGTTYLLVNGVKRAIGDLQVELLDAGRKVVASIKSASDGYFVLPGVLPGSYLLRVSPEQLARLALSDTGMHMVEVSADGSFVNGRDFIVQALAQ